MATTLDDYTDEELGRILRQAAKDLDYIERERVNTREAFCSFLRMVGLDWIADIIEVALWAWERIRRIWRYLFG